MKVAIVTCAAYPDLSASDALYGAALERAGAAVAAVPWNRDPDAGGAKLAGADAVVLRSPWDYPQHLPAFARWIAALEVSGARLFNPPALVRWNVDKRYLLDLERAGVAIPPLRVLPPEAGEDDLREALASLAVSADGRAVLKPIWGGSGFGVGPVSPRTLAADFARVRAEATGCPLIVQTYVPQIAVAGEISLVFIGGRFAHAVRKRPAEGEFRVNTRFSPPAPERIAPSSRVREGAERVLRALPGDAPPLYARIDGVEVDGGFVCLEAELVDPALFLHLAPESAELLARATVAAIAAPAQVRLPA